jgi:hypothetical protein
MDGLSPAAWSMKKGKHVMIWSGAAFKLPPVKPEVVVGQIRIII